MEAADNALKTLFCGASTWCHGRVGRGEKSSWCREKTGVKSVDLCIERLHVMIYDSWQYARGQIRGGIGCVGGVRFYAGAH